MRRWSTNLRSSNPTGVQSAPGASTTPRLKRLSEGWTSNTCHRNNCTIKLESWISFGPCVRVHQAIAIRIIHQVEGYNTKLILNNYPTIECFRSSVYFLQLNINILHVVSKQATLIFIFCHIFRYAYRLSRRRRFSSSRPPSEVGSSLSSDTYTYL